MEKKAMERLRKEQKTKKQSLEAFGSVGFDQPGMAPGAESAISAYLSDQEFSQNAIPIIFSFGFLDPPLMISHSDSKILGPLGTNWDSLGL